MDQKPDFHEAMDRLLGHTPGWAGRNFDRLRRPLARILHFTNRKIEQRKERRTDKKAS
jgi:hypothetical protein